MLYLSISLCRFVVELCEMVQLQSLEIANLELFSSLPESFVVSISDRFVLHHVNAVFITIAYPHLFNMVIDSFKHVSLCF